MALDKSYEPTQKDIQWQKHWDALGVATPEKARPLQKSNSGSNFVVMMPPPNVTGVLHQGHALMLALEDTLTRWRRMCGDDTLYLPGTDHASIAVQTLVVKHLESKGIDYRTLGREKFLEECWRWIRDYQPRIYQQVKKLGVSCDWSRVKFTMDPNLNRSVDAAFVEFYKRGLVYRAERLVNWSPKGQTGLSDLEVIYQEREGSLWHLRYPLADDPSQFLVVATTRPETMLGDSAVAVHPDDPRYKKFIGKMIRLPLTDRLIPVIADDFVDLNFGSGAVKITPAHDHTDFEVGTRHKLPRINVLTTDAKVIAGLPGRGAEFAGLDRFKAREKIVEALTQLGLLDRIEKHKNRVGLSERWNDIVEPYLSMQWYVKMDGMAAKAMAAVSSNECQIIPHEFHNQFMRWMENIKDWCVSRQLWWGQSIPAYHCGDCPHIEVALQAPIECPKCKSKKITPDPDVFDTWFSSGIWPFSTLGWPEMTADLQKYYPTSVLETGFDILFFWVARMLMMGLELTGKAPFAKVLMHPLVRDENGQKMSKSKGNVIDPLEIIDEVGADTLRLTLNALCVQGRDMRLSQERLDTYRAFINKLWNASKFVLMDEEIAKLGTTWNVRPKATLLHDRWILARLDSTARDVSKAWNDFRMQEAAEHLYHFLWNDYCDWYLEAAKTSRETSRSTLIYVLGEMLKLLHPVIPHVTEELYHALPGVKESDTLAVQAFPQGEAFPDTDALAEFKFVQDCVTGLRNLRAESKVPPAKKIAAMITQVAGSSKTTIENSKAVIELLAKLSQLEVGKTSAGPSTKVVVTALEAGSSVEFVVPVTELVDLGEEKLRLAKEVETLEKIIAAQNGKLSNESFVSRAPPEVIQKEKLKLEEAQDKLQKTRVTLTQLS